MSSIGHTINRVVQPPHASRPAAIRREHYLLLLTWAFTFFSSARVLSYLPTLMLIIQQENSSQHSLLTWMTWLGSNLTMAGWLHEQNGRRFNRAVAVNLVNAAMCAATLTVIAWYRL